MHLVIFYLENRVKQSKYKADIQKIIEYIYWNNYLLTKSIEVQNDRHIHNFCIYVALNSNTV